MHQSDIHNDIIQLVESLKEEIVSLKEDILSTIHPEQDYRSLQLEFLLHTIEDQFVRFAEIILEYNAVLYDYLVVLFQDASVSIRRQPKDSYGHVSSIENICVSQDVLFLVYGEGNNISDKGYKRPLQQICPHAEYFPVEKRSSDLYMLRSATNYQYSSDMCDQYSVEYLIQHFQEKQNKTIVVSNSFRSLKQIEAIVRATGVDQIILPGHTPGSFGKLVQTFQSMESGIFFVTYDYWNKLHFALQGAAQSVFMHRLPMPNTHGTEFQYLAKNMGYEGIEAYFNVAVPLGYCAFEKFLSECRLPLVLGDQAHRKKYSALFTAGKDISVIAND
ncbi:MAG: hypothetical protein U9Q15_05395 [Patescibacteria group bacterium]|nr:hypothetical protein [Patescibacteria group bacterium]